MARASKEVALDALSDHDLLMVTATRVIKLDACVREHLKHHWAVTLAGITGLFAALGTLAVVLLTR